MDNKAIENMRRDYRLAELDEASIDDNPLAQFTLWFDQAVESQILEPNVMTLATVDEKGQPDARIVLLKGYDEQGFRFFTHYESSKGKQIKQNAHVALVFYWQELERQVRIHGQCQKLSESDSIAYFQKRPRGSQIGAWASPQSQHLKSRQSLVHQVEVLTQQYDGQDKIPKPDFWGGYLVIPSMIEFWQGRASRLHDRFRYEYLNLQWTHERLAP